VPMRNLTRMLPWAVLAFLLYAVALSTPQPQIQTLLWKLGHITLGANVANDLSEIRQALSLWTDNHPNTTPPELFARHIDALSAVNKQLRDRKAEQKEGAR
jgi:hypothetical protein